MTTCDDFYVYLKSSSNITEFTSNKHNSFTNVVKPSLHLNDEYEVALQNIIFTPDIIAIKAFDPTYEICFNVQFINLNKRKGSGYMVNYIPTENIFGGNIEEILDGFNRNLIKFLKLKKVIISSQDYIFKYDRENKVIKFKELQIIETVDFTPNVEWTITEKTRVILGVDKLKFENTPEEFYTPLYFPIEMMNVFTDIIEPSYFGEQTVHLLDVIPLQHVFSKNGTLTMYKRVNRRLLDSISIKITDEKGIVVPFTDRVHVLIVLHFRRVM